jgi:hypothetical protein
LATTGPSFAGLSVGPLGRPVRLCLAVVTDHALATTSCLVAPRGPRREADSGQGAKRRRSPAGRCATGGRRCRRRTVDPSMPPCQALAWLVPDHARVGRASYSSRGESEPAMHQRSDCVRRTAAPTEPPEEVTPGKSPRGEPMDAVLELHAARERRCGNRCSRGRTSDRAVDPGHEQLTPPPCAGDLRVAGSAQALRPPFMHRPGSGLGRASSSPRGKSGRRESGPPGPRAPLANRRRPNSPRGDLGVARAVNAGPAFDFASSRGTYLFPCTANIAPCGSKPCAIQSPPGTSIGPLTICPPFSLTRSAAACTSSTMM